MIGPVCIGTDESAGCINEEANKGITTLGCLKMSCNVTLQEDKQKNQVLRSDNKMFSFGDNKASS